MQIAPTSGWDPVRNLLLPHLPPIVHHYPSNHLPMEPMSSHPMYIHQLDKIRRWTISWTRSSCYWCSRCLSLNSRLSCCLSLCSRWCCSCVELPLNLCLKSCIRAEAFATAACYPFVLHDKLLQQAAAAAAAFSAFSFCCNKAFFSFSAVDFQPLSSIVLLFTSFLLTVCASSSNCWVCLQWQLIASLFSFVFVQYLSLSRFCS